MSIDNNAAVTLADLSFSFHWNNKLSCNAFTTLRISDKYNVGQKVNIVLRKELICHGEIVGKKELTLDAINDYIAYIDTGYDTAECRKILVNMYKKNNINWQTQKLYFYLIKKIEIEK